jgi:hypothetical protein
MRITRRLFTLAVVWLGIPAAIMAQSRDERCVGAYVLSVVGPDMPTISAVSLLDSGGQLKEIDYQPVQSFFGNGAKTRFSIGEGTWHLSDRGELTIEYKTELPNKMSQRVNGTAIFAPSGSEFEGSATVTIVNQAGTAVYVGKVTVTGHKVSTGRLSANR